MGSVDPMGGVMTTLRAVEMQGASFNQNRSEWLLTFKLKDESKLKLTLERRAWLSNLLAMLTRPRVGKLIPADTILKIAGFRGSLVENWLPCLEFSLGQDIFVRVGFPKESIADLRSAIQDIEDMVNESQQKKH
jgi:hypothetical protein